MCTNTETGRGSRGICLCCCVKVQCHTFHAGPFQEPGVNISFYGSTPPHPLLFSSIWAMKIKANEILLMHKMRMGKAHSSTWWHSINWWLLNSSLFVPAAALLDWDNMRVPVTALATGLSMCACVCVQPDLNTTHPLLGAFWCFLDLIWPAWETFWIRVTTIAFKFKYFIQNSRAYLRMHYIRWTLQLCARSRRPAPARLSCLGNLGRWLLVNSWCCL